MLPYYNKNIIENLTDTQIDTAYLKKQEENIIYDVREAIANYEQSGYTNSSHYTAKQMLSDDEFVARVIDNYYDQLCDNREDIYAAIDSVIEFEHYVPQAKIEVHPSEERTAMKRLFVDMDGTLARFHDEVSYLERMFEEHFFRDLKPFENMVEGLHKFIERNPDVEVFILSAAVDGEPPYCQKEKHEWLNKYLPEIDKQHRIFTKVGAPKADFIPGGITKNDYLLDDYNVGLEQWQRDGGYAIKAKNNINHKGLIGKLWDGDIVCVLGDPNLIARDIKSVMDGTTLNASRNIRR